MTRSHCCARERGALGCSPSPRPPRRRCWPALAVIGAGVATAPAADAAPGSCATTGLVTSCTFAHNGSWQSWTVPAGVHKATFVVVGAAGGNAGGEQGGRGGGVEASLQVSPGQEYKLYVGGKGGSEADPVGARGLGGWNGGGASGGGIRGGAGGGGASDVRVAPYGISDRILVGGGGGGAGTRINYYGYRGYPGAGGPGSGVNGGRGGAGGGNLGASDAAYASSGASGHGGAGGTATAAGAGGQPTTDIVAGGCDSWPAQPLAGAGGAGAVGGAGGYLKVLGVDRRCDQLVSWGGGGGGGWHGGGGGGSGANGAGGGGGGSGHAASGYYGSRLGEPGAHGVITISYVRPADGWVGLGGETMTSAPTVAVRPWNGSRLTSFHDVFFLNAAGAVIQRTFFEGVPRPDYNLGATLHPGSTVAAVWRDGFPSRLDLFGRGTEGALWQKSFDGTSWGPWLARTGPGVVASDPTAVSMGSGRLDVFFRGADDKLNQLTSTNGRWSALPTTVHGPTITTGPGATYTSPGRVDLLAGCGPQLCWWTYDGSSLGLLRHRAGLPACPRRRRWSPRPRVSSRPSCATRTTA